MYLSVCACVVASCFMIAHSPISRTAGELYMQNENEVECRGKTCDYFEFDTTSTSQKVGMGSN